MEEDLTTGFRFYPTEDELVVFYLRNQLEGRSGDSMHRVIPVLDVFEVEPSHLPDLAGERCRGDAEQWFFFVPRQEREARGGRPSRTTGSGYWKATGSPGPVFSKDNRMIGVKKTMVFYTGKAPTGGKTKWKMNEYKALDDRDNVSTIPKVAFAETSFIVGTSPEISMSGGEHVDLSVDTDMVDGLTEPIWEWEQLNWP
ncbi:hypothetical protein Bca4012_001117 [Brassica carinata]